MAEFGTCGVLQLRAFAESADSFQGSCDAGWITGKLNRCGIGKEFSLPADCGANEGAEEGADKSEEKERRTGDCQEGGGVVFLAAPRGECLVARINARPISDKLVIP